MDIESIFREYRLAEQAIFRQSLADKSERIAELEQKIELLEDMLNRIRPTRVAPAQTTPSPPHRYMAIPRRWSVK